MSASQALASDVAEVTGFIEAATADAVLGWAWSPLSPQARVTIELRLGGAVLAEVSADASRDDLVASGIGDGCHAFAIPVPASARARLAELQVTGRVGGGEAVLLGRPPSADGVADRLDRLQKGVEMVVASQRVLHRNLQAVLLRPPVEEAVPSTIADQLRMLEIFVMRLDERLATLASPESAPRQQFGLRRAALAASLATLLLLAAAGLFRSLAL